MFQGEIRITGGSLYDLTSNLEAAFHKTKTFSLQSLNCLEWRPLPTLEASDEIFSRGVTSLITHFAAYVA